MSSLLIQNAKTNFINQDNKGLLSTKILTKEYKSKTLITFLTHGVCGKAGHWSNMLNYFDYEVKNFNYKDTKELEKLHYTPDCIMSLLSKVIESNVYYARVSKGQSSFNMLLVDLSAQHTKDFLKNNSKYNLKDNIIVNPYIIDSIPNIPRHSIIVFESANPDESHHLVYNQFKFMVLKIITDVKKINNYKFFKINLIGHSRGGITNLQYALDYPEIVDSMFSLGTPFFGSDVLNLGALMSIDLSTPAYINIKDPIIQNTLATRWNDNFNKLYSSINFHVMGGYSPLTFYTDMLLSTHNVRFFSKTLNMSKILIKDLLRVLDMLIHDLIVIKINDLVVSPHHFIIGRLSKILTPLGFKKDIKIIIGFIFDNLRLSIIPPFVDFSHDALVQLDSQLAISNLSNNSLTYKGVKRYAKRFTLKNSNINKVTTNKPSIVHNLETRDTQLLNYIIKNINVSKLD